jgi:murein DD-endopeptidase MepM/ murein hydrolase activator NlpD
MPGDPSSDVRGVPFADIPEVPGDQPQLQAARDVVLPQGDIEPMPVGMAPEDQWQFALQSPLQQSLGTDRILIPLGDVWGNVSPQNGYDFGQPTSYSPSHFGVDLRATEGTPVRAPRAARVVAIQTAGSGSYPVGAEGFGTAVRMEDDRGRVFIFAHLSSIDPSIVPGAVVQAGQYFAAAGWTGNVYPSDANGSHLHFEVQDESGNQINPHDILVKNDQGGGGAGGGMLSRILTLKPLSHREQSGLRSTDLVGRG